MDRIYKGQAEDIERIVESYILKNPILSSPILSCARPYPVHPLHSFHPVPPFRPSNHVPPPLFPYPLVCPGLLAADCGRFTTPFV